MVDLEEAIYTLAQQEKYRPYMIERYLLLLGTRGTYNLLGAFSKPPVPSIRINTASFDKDMVTSRLEKKGFHLEAVPWTSDGFWIYDKEQFKRSEEDLGLVSRFKIPPGATHEYILGMYSMQGASSMLPAVLLDPKPGEEVLDMAAAPGSKLVQMSQMMKNKGILVGIDRSDDRIKALKSNVERCLVKNTVIIHQDSRALDDHFEGFDKILLDAPCTGEGLIGSDPTRKYSRTLNDIKKMMGVQVALLERALALVKPGGRVVYSTCSLAPEEDEHVVSTVLEKHKNYRLVEPPRDIIQFFNSGFPEAFGVKFIPSIIKTLRVFQSDHPCRPEGFFVAIIERTR